MVHKWIPTVTIHYSHRDITITLVNFNSSHIHFLYWYDMIFWSFFKRIFNKLLWLFTLIVMFNMYINYFSWSKFTRSSFLSLFYWRSHSQPQDYSFNGPDLASICVKMVLLMLLAIREENFTATILQYSRRHNFTLKLVVRN